MIFIYAWNSGAFSVKNVFPIAIHYIDRFSSALMAYIFFVLNVRILQEKKEKSDGILG